MIDTFKQIELGRIKFEDVKNEKGEVVDIKSTTETRNYMLAFNVNVIDQLDQKYRSGNKNGFQLFLEKLDSENLNDIWKTSVEFLTMCVNEGIRQENIHRKAAGLKEIEYFKNEEINITAMNSSSLALEVLSNGMPQQKN